MKLTAETVRKKYLILFTTPILLLVVHLVKDEGMVAGGRCGR